jgi:hypothetical protein
MNGDVYTRLREFMDTLPGGYPAAPIGVGIELLKELFTPEHGGKAGYGAASRELHRHAEQDRGRARFAVG